MLKLRKDRPATIEEHRALRAENKRLRAALVQIRLTCEGNAAPSCDKGMALAFVGDVARHAIEQLPTETK